MSKAFLGIGTNSGDRLKNIEDTVSLIATEIGKILQISPVYETDPLGFSSENKFLNLAISITTDLSPWQLLDRIQLIENMLGRIRGAERYSDRTIDIDILFYDELVLNEANLVIPHPRLHERRFVLEPLSDIAPDFIHPVFRDTVVSLLRSCKDNSKIIRSGISLR